MFIELTTRVGKTSINTALIEFFALIESGAREKTSIHLSTGKLAVMEEYDEVKLKVVKSNGRIPTKTM